MRRKMPPRLAQGQAGVYSVAAQLLLRGMVPSFPAVDIGADLYTEMGTRIQVKCGGVKYQGSYSFCLVHGPSSNKRGYDDRIADGFHLDSDFHVFWGINDNRFWIVPSGFLEGKTAVAMPPRESAYLRVDEAAIVADHNSGMRQIDIARKYGLSKHQICDVVNAKRSSGLAERIAFTRQLLDYQDRWDLITEYERTLSEAQVAAYVPSESLKRI